VVCATSLLSTHYEGVTTKTGWLGINIMCRSLLADCCFRELAPYFSINFFFNFSINIRWHSPNVSSDSRKWLIKHLFPPSSCKKQINKQNSYISKHGAKEMGHVKMAGPDFVNDVTAWWPGFVPNFFYEQTGTKATEIHNHHCFRYDNTHVNFSNHLQRN
jgi:hypothetical protein